MQIRRFGIPFSFFLLAATLAFAQNKNIAERLGYPLDAKLLIIHADDLAVAHSEDVASFDALDIEIEGLAMSRGPSVTKSAPEATSGWYFGNVRRSWFSSAPPVFTDKILRIR